MPEMSLSRAPHLFFSVAKSKPSASKRVFVHPGAGRLLEAHHVAVALHSGARTDSSDFTVRVHEPNRRLGSSASEVEFGLVMGVSCGK